MPGLFEDAEEGEAGAGGAGEGGAGAGGGAGEGQDGAGAGGAGEGSEGEGAGAGERPDWLPETAWKEGAVDLDGLKTAFEGAGKAADLPADADSYVLPTIEGFDAEKAASSPIIKAFQKAAFAGGVGQAGFEAGLKDYIAAETERYGADAAAETAKLGSNAKGRLTAVATFVRGAVPKAQAEAILSMATSADAVIGLEALMNSRAGPKPRVDPPAADQRKTKEQIESLMATPAYSGKPHQRDPAVVKEVDDWFAAEAATKK